MQTQRLRQVSRQLGDRFGNRIHFLSLSIDPENDTPAALKKFAAKQYADIPGWRFLVGDKATMERLLKRIGQWTDEPSDHSTLMIAGNARKAHWKKINPIAPIERITADLLTLDVDS